MPVTSYSRDKEGEKEMIEKINSGYYKVKDSFPARPSKPKMPTNGKSEEFAKYAEDLKAYEELKSKYDEQLKEYRKKGSELNKQFEEDAMNDVFGKEDRKKYPKTVSKIFWLAYDKGHAYGHSEVYSYLVDYAEILNAVKADVERK